GDFLCRDSTAGRRERASQLPGVGLALHLRTESDRDLGDDLALRVGHRASIPEGPAEQMTTTPPDLAVEHDGSSSMWTSRLRRRWMSTLPPDKLLPDRQPAYVA